MACILGACTPKPISGEKTLKIGGCLPLTGPASVAGLAFKQGWDMAVEKINNEGGLKIGADTYKIDLIIEDDKASPEASTTAATKLCYQDNVKFVLGSLAAVLMGPMYQVTKEVWGTGDPKFTTCFRSRPRQLYRGRKGQATSHPHRGCWR